MAPIIVYQLYVSSFFSVFVSLFFVSLEMSLFSEYFVPSCIIAAPFFSRCLYAENIVLFSFRVVFFLLCSVSFCLVTSDQKLYFSTSAYFLFFL